MTKVFLSGPMRGHRHFNFHTFLDVAIDLEDQGFEVVSPASHDLDGGFDPWGLDGTEDLDGLGFDLEAAMEWDLAQVLECDQIVMLPGWESSVGAKREKAYAETNGKAVRYAWYDGASFLKHKTWRTTWLPTGTGHVNEWSQERIRRLADERSPLNVTAMLKAWDRLLKGAVDDWDDTLAVKTGLAPPLDGEGLMGGLDPEANVMESEVRVTNATTGGQKGQKLARFDLVPVGPLTALAEHYGRGAAKYEDRNWEKGTDWSLNYAAMLRHATQWWGGEDVDPETGSHHLAAVAWHAFALLEFASTHPELDDRPDGIRSEDPDEPLPRVITNKHCPKGYIYVINPSTLLLDGKPIDPRRDLPA